MTGYLPAVPPNSICSRFYPLLSLLQEQHLNKAASLPKVHEPKVLDLLLFWGEFLPVLM